MNELLTIQGWKKFYECNTCSRFGPVQYYNNPLFKDYEIRVRPRKNTFTIWSKNMQIYGPAWLYEIESALKKFNIYVEVPASES